MGIDDPGSTTGAGLRTALAMAGIACFAAVAGAGVREIREEVSIQLDIDVLAVARGDTVSLGRHVIPVGADAPGSLALDLEGPSGWGRFRLEVDATGTLGSTDGAHEINLAARVVSPDGREATVSRSMSLSDGSTGLFEVYADDERHLVLALRAERSSRLFAASSRKRAGAEVAFRLEIERSEDDRFVPLETNFLSTFVGESVEYSFHIGNGTMADSLRITLTPVLLRGDVAEVDVDVTGHLPGAEAPVLVSRSERILASRGATSSVVVVAGNPPLGYRFRMTPIF